ncbi:MAG: hypothetical protein ABGX16_08380 [Pirellulales bacterium]
MAKKTVTKKSPAKKAPKKKDTGATKKAAKKVAKKAAKKVAKKAAKKAPEKKAKEAKKKKTPKKRARKAAKVIRLKAFWGVFNQSLRRVALFEFNEKKLAEKKAKELSKSGKSPHFVQPVKEAIEDDS